MTNGRKTILRAPVALPVVECDARELLELLELQAARVVAEGKGALRARLARFRLETASERAYWRAVARAERR